MPGPSARTHSAVAPPAGEQPLSWQERQALLNRRTAEAGAAARVIFVGDSITQGWEQEGRETWAHYYAGRKALNLGIGGDRTQHVLWRLNHGNLDGLSPEVAVVLIGTNNTEGEEYTVGQIAEGVAAIVARIREKLSDTRILLVAILPRSENPSIRRGKVLQVNQVIRKLADGDRVRWLDFGDRFVGFDGLIASELMPDFLHLSPLGYALWAEAMEDELSAMLGDPRVAPLAPTSPPPKTSARLASMDGTGRNTGA
ncbi:MAG: 1-alkyl-2-acetylglycerophosphocholine esterase [Verrucomicrobia bacterium]|nr:1-alkyl-2-acetylglycerophosphocholine esterase [Verrucomicrobiota bacterium]